jgi:hypothetical protein
MIPLLNRGGLMKGFVQGADRQQTTLLPECLDDWVDSVMDPKPKRAIVLILYCSGTLMRRKSIF